MNLFIKKILQLIKYSGQFCDVQEKTRNYDKGTELEPTLADKYTAVPCQLTRTSFKNDDPVWKVIEGSSYQQPYDTAICFTAEKKNETLLDYKRSDIIVSGGKKYEILQIIKPSYWQGESAYIKLLLITND